MWRRRSARAEELSQRQRSAYLQTRRGGTYSSAASTVLQRESSSRQSAGKCRNRIIFLGLMFAVCYLTLAARVVDIAVVQPWLMASAGADGEPIQVLATDTSFRSSIVDRNGVLLASSVSSRSLYANPQLVQRFGVDEAVDALHHIFPEMSRETLRHRLSSDRTFVYIKRHLSPREQAAVNAIGVPGLEFEESEQRIYPHGELFSHILGYVGVDNQGLAGIEKHFDNELKAGERELQLSVDARAQHILREELMAGVEEFQAIGAVGAIMDVQTGEMIAMSSLPDFDPHNPADASKDAIFNRATTGVYEMGSTFKTFTIAMGLEYGTAQMHSGYDARNPIRFAGHTIRDSHPEARWLTVPEIFIHSSNIGTVKMVMDVGKKRQKTFLRKLGMMERLPLELPEVAEPLTPRRWRDINMMTISYGHGISVTPIHLLRAIASLVGDGALLTPTLVKAETILEEEREPIVSQETVMNIRKLLGMVVQYGTGKKANAEGYRVGGKTGTAEKAKGGRYAAHDKLASFVGVFPVDEPKYAILVMLDEPRGNKSTYGFATGGWVSAPVVKRVVERIAPLYGMKPIYELPEGATTGRKRNKPHQYIHDASF